MYHFVSNKCIKCCAGLNLNPDLTWWILTRPKAEFQSTKKKKGTRD